DAYLLRYVGDANAEGRLHLDAWTLGSWGQAPAVDALCRLLEGRAALLGAIQPQTRADLAARDLDAHLPALRRVLDLAATEVLGDAPTATSPERLDAPRAGPIGACGDLASFMVDINALIRL